MQPEVRRGRPPKQVREPRAPEITRERRRRADLETVGRRLGVNPDILDLENYTYRWINDDQVTRLYQLTELDDYDIVMKNGNSVADKDSDLGEAVSTVTGVLPNGQQQRTYLARKPRKWYEADEKRKQDDLDEQLARLKRGHSREGEAQADYIPHGGINL